MLHLVINLSCINSNISSSNSNLHSNNRYRYSRFPLRRDQSRALITRSLPIVMSIMVESRSRVIRLCNRPRPKENLHFLLLSWQSMVMLHIQSWLCIRKLKFSKHSFKLSVPNNKKKLWKISTKYHKVRSLQSRNRKRSSGKLGARWNRELANNCQLHLTQ